MEPVPRSSFQPAAAGGLLLAATAVCTGVGAAVGAVAGSAGIGALAGAAVGIPVGTYAVYRRYNEDLSA